MIANILKPEGMTLDSPAAAKLFTKTIFVAQQS